MLAKEKLLWYSVHRSFIITGGNIMKKALLSLGLAVLLVAMFATPAFAATYKAQLGMFLDENVNAEVGAWPDNGAWIVEFEKGKQATITVTFDAPVKFAGPYAALETDFPWSDDMADTSMIISVKLDGVDYPLTTQYINQEGLAAEGGRGVRLNLCNEWNSDITTQPILLSELPEFSKLEITFIVGEAEGAPPPPPGGGGDKESAKTGDTAMIGLAVLALGLGGLGAFILKRKVTA
jgi:LPXTG-motif cell wall-anchored protein